MKVKVSLRLSNTFCCIIILLLLSICMFVTWGCEKRKEPARVGFVGGLTGRLSGLGIAGRNGVTLAVEEINEAGGINGRPVELITRDDRQDPKVAVKVDRELIDEGVVAIIGHMTTSMSMATLPLINKEEILMISPTTSTNKLTGIDDYFIRVMAPNKSQTDHLARYAFKSLGLRKMAAVYDLSNRTYSEEFLNNVRSEFKKMGGEIILCETFTSGTDVSFKNLAGRLLEPDPEGLLIVAGALDTAMICQHIRMTGSNAPIFSCGWGMTGDLLDHGGPAVEGIIFFSRLLDRESQHEGYLKFRQRFSRRFNLEPDFAAAHGYEAAHLLFEALKINGGPEELKAAILKQGVFKGVQGDIRVDKYGDPQRKRFLITVKDNKFKTMD
ncbi:MAG: ABC transporter substrate-binding protein [Thermodesulfobacteriota bacterium]|nr:ABC transporter substrate-binding protein [Thermodesulfobacteriota bacterium]